VYVHHVLLLLGALCMCIMFSCCLVHCVCASCSRVF